MGTLAENVARVKADFKSIKDMAHRTIGSYLDNVPTSEYAERMENGITSNYDTQYNWGVEQGRYEGYESGKNDGINEGYTIGKGDGLYEGVEQGRQEVISKSKYIEKTVSGKGVFLDDVSEVAHKVKVYAGTPTEVKICGKNLFDISVDTRLTKQDDGSYINNVKLGTAKIPLALPYGTYVISYDLACPSGNNARIRVYLKDGSFSEYALSSNGDFLHFEHKIVGEIESWGFYYASQPTAGTLRIKNAQIELDSATEYEPYNEKIVDVTSNGAEVDSMCPIMTFLADNDVTVDYYSSYGMESQRRKWWKDYITPMRTNGAASAFYGACWNDKTFDPPIDIVTTSANSLFYMSYVQDVRGIMARNNVSFVFLDTVASYTQFFTLFQGARVKYLPYLKLPKTSTCYGWFYNCKYLVEVDGYECTEKHTFETSSGATQTFYNCTELVKILFYGTIANKLDIHWSTKLSRESILSLLQCLKATVSGITITLPTMCIDTATDTLALIQSDTELNTAYTQALANGYTITFA